MAFSTSLTPDGLVTALLGAAEAEFLSAQLWPLDLALQAVEDASAWESELRLVLARMPQAAVRNGIRFTGIRSTLHGLVRRRLLVPSGSGWSAGYTVDARLVTEGRRLVETLDGRDERALVKAGQALRAATSMASKNPAPSAMGSAAI